MDEEGGGDVRRSFKDDAESESNTVLSGCIVITCLLIIGGLITLLILNEDMPSRLRRHAHIRSCHTPSCYQMTQELRFSATHSVDPCVDFFSHVCNGWAKSSSMDFTVAQAVEGGFVDELEKQLRGYTPSRNQQGVIDMTAILYQSCVKLGNANLSPVMRKFHLKNWPQIYSSDGHSFDVFAEVMNADLSWNMKLVFEVERVYLSDLGRSRIVIRPSPLACPYRDSRNVTLRGEYARYVHEVFSVFGNFNTVMSVEIATFHHQLCNFAALPDDEYSYYYLGSVINATTAIGIDESKWLNRLKPLGNLTPMSVVYTKLEYVESALKLLIKDTTANLVMQYMGLVIATQFAAAHPKIRAAQDRRPFLVLPSDPYRRLQTEPCTKEVMVNFLTGWNLLAIQSSNQNRATTLDIINLLQSIVAATQQTIRISTWMDEESKARTLHKLKKSTVIGPVVQMYAMDYNLRYRLDGLRAFSDDYYDNLLKIRRSEALFRLSGMKRYSAERNFASVDAEADLRENTFYIYAGLLHTPYYAESLPLAVKYGGIGTWIARALAKSLTGQGARMDDRGGPYRWWLAPTYKEYLSRAMCFARQANPSSTSVSDADYIDDYLGVRIAYDALDLALARRKVRWKLPNSHFSDSQMFFMTYCLGICATTMQRDGKTALLDSAMRMCNGALMNMPEFARTYSCRGNVSMGTQTQQQCELY